MRKVLLIALVAMGTICAKAQITWNVKAGAGLSFITGLDDEGERKGKAVWKAGVGAEIPVTGNFMVMPSLEFAQKGMNWEITEDLSGTTYQDKDNVTINYLQIPVLGAYRINLGTVNMTLKLGPYFAYGLSGNTKSESIYGNQYENNKYDLFDEENGGKRFDLGGIVGMDFEWRRIVLGLEYERGFTPLIKDKIDDIKCYNSSLFITIGYKFTL